MNYLRRAARWRHARQVRAAANGEDPTCHMRFPLPLVVLLVATRLTAQTPVAETAGPKPSDSAPVTFTAEQDHQNMMTQLGIRRLRPGPSGDESAPNHANYDETRANPYPILPELLTTRGGDRVTTPAAWWTRRRPELVEALEREVYGRVPAHVPRVSWTVTVTDREFVGFTPVVARRLVGHVDNRAYPAIAVDIAMTVVVPANARGPVPLLLMFGRSALPAPAQPAPDALEKINSALKQLLVARDSSLRSVFEQYPAYEPVGRMAVASPPFGAPPAVAGGDPPPAQQLIAAGWGYALLDPTSVQADNGAGLTRGIIGLVNRGQPRRPDDWGALRAWAWGAGRALDYFETDSTVDARRVGIEGVSRYGKAALVALAFDQRFAVGLIGSSGKGGATLHRRVWGEAVESLASAGEYHWMAGNYLRYAAAEASFGSRDAGALPVDAHALIALCAPRPTFISYGIPERGDAKWLDQKGSYMATVAAGSVFKLLGARDLGVSNDYRAEPMPAVNVGLLDGQLAWRQHDGGHTDAPNVRYFIPWATRMLHPAPVAPAAGR